MATNPPSAPAQQPVAKSSIAVARDLTAAVDRKHRGKEFVRVVATKTGYDGKQIREEGARFLVPKPVDGKKLPGWQVLEADFDRTEAERRLAAELAEAEEQ